MGTRNTVDLVIFSVKFVKGMIGFESYCKVINSRPEGFVKDSTSINITSFLATPNPRSKSKVELGAFFGEQGCIS